MVERWQMDGQTDGVDRRKEDRKEEWREEEGEINEWSPEWWELNLALGKRGILKKSVLCNLKKLSNFTE